MRTNRPFVDEVYTPDEGLSFKQARGDVILRSMTPLACLLERETFIRCRRSAKRGELCVFAPQIFLCASHLINFNQRDL